MLSHIKIVLVETSHAGNIGAVARAMKNMTLTQLALVNPKQFPCAEATARAAGADDVLSRATVYNTLQEAIADCQLVIGASARSRTISWPEITPRACAKQVVHDKEQRVAIVFGRENSGLKNHELDLCQFLLHIPCNPEYSSLNVAAAVQVVCYELFVETGFKSDVLVGDKGESPLASAEQMDGFYQHLHDTLLDVGFMQPEKSKSIMRRLRRIFNRTLLNSKEVDILRGIFKMAQNHNKSKE